MGKWFNQASTIASLERDVAFLEREKVLAETEKDRMEARLNLAEADLAGERKAHNLALRRYADQISKQAKLPEHFVADVTPKPPEVPDPDVEARILMLAKMQMDADVDMMGEAPWPLENYVNEIRKQGIDNVILN
jgi:hypothetical protein